jgi:hypothetical protein
LELAVSLVALWLALPALGLCTPTVGLLLLVTSYRSSSIYPTRVVGEPITMVGSVGLCSRIYKGSVAEALKVMYRLLLRTMAFVSLYIFVAQNMSEELIIRPVLQ